MTQYSKMEFEEFIAYAQNYTIDACHPQIVDEAITRLDHLRAENERLATLIAMKDGVIDKLENTLSTRCAEAYKECYEKVKQKLLDKGFYPAIVKSAFDEVEKEMVDKEKESYNRR